MALDQYRLQPLPPRKKPIWKILVFGTLVIFLIAVLTFTLFNQRVFCNVIGGEWLPFPEWRSYTNRWDFGRPSSADIQMQMNEPELWAELHGKCVWR
ncbi:MAG: hypothetical protein HY867_09560 [Chloroflexi bacterium]|nr:hypothetical protein [Chloroflexota bacterium]